MHTYTKRIVPITVVVFFVFMCFSCTVGKMHDGSFNYYTLVETEIEKGDFVEKTDGTRIYGKEIDIKTGMLQKKGVIMDGQQYKFSDVKSFRHQGIFWTKLAGQTFVKRIVRGKINVYVDRREVITTTRNSAGGISSGTSSSFSEPSASHYAQVGDDGKLIFLSNQGDIKKLVATCAEAVSLISLSDSQIRKAIRANPSYLNNVFETYNNDCKLVNNNPKNR